MKYKGKYTHIAFSPCNNQQSSIHNVKCTDIYLQRKLCSVWKGTTKRYCSLWYWITELSILEWEIVDLSRDHEEMEEKEKRKVKMEEEEEEEKREEMEEERERRWKRKRRRRERDRTMEAHLISLSLRLVSSIIRLTRPFWIPSMSEQVPLLFEVFPSSIMSSIILIYWISTESKSLHRCDIPKPKLLRLLS